MSPSAHGATRRCQRTRRSWPTDRSSQGRRAISTTMINRRYAPENPASRPPAINRPPGADSDPRVSSVTTNANVAPNPKPATPKQASPIQFLGVWPGLRRDGDEDVPTEPTMSAAVGGLASAT